MGSSGVEAVDRKQKIRDRYKGVDASELEVIPAKAVEGFGESTSVRRVAAYVRVSTDDDEQTSSYELQKNYYTEYIKAQPGWEFVGIYDDEGISGTSLEHRKGYDAATGKMLVCVNPQWFRPTDVDNLWGDPTKAKTVLGWNPQSTTYEQLVEIMAKHDRERAKREKALKAVL